MNPVQALLLVAASLSVAQGLTIKALPQFRKMILCVLPESWPILHYTDYGCYCGRGGSGAPVDDLDRCCQVHDRCYSDSMQFSRCWPIIENPYTKFYDYSCDKNKNITCGSSNNGCGKFICECDRKAAQCFAKTTWKPEHEHLPSRRCK
ncbi:phospholipase A2-like isoform X2 [Betta splendens]|uniref:Phospholipase A2 n=1 Tax=Betta splendens TaxID=158456 RepID=A0A6P7NWD5_BETSP|nr:phospholipase A2-like isoform X2 [Betta splendens]